ncbi:hypothetical protein [Deinococcus altitudinis]|uniref:hypothetical protein n=1 Tax=Deinococcus altitudinis TaxID=468914 RepID=UPI003891D774
MNAEQLLSSPEVRGVYRGIFELAVARMNPQNLMTLSDEAFLQQARELRDAQVWYLEFAGATDGDLSVFDTVMLDVFGSLRQWIRACPDPSDVHGGVVTFAHQVLR